MKYYICRGENNLESPLKKKQKLFNNSSSPSCHFLKYLTFKEGVK